MTPRRSSDNWLWIAVVLSLGISLTRFGPLVLYPFKLFTTWVHECGHAVMTLIVGGSVASIAIEPNTAGLTTSFIPQGRIAQGLVASAGYLTASIVGCVLMTATRGKKNAHAILWVIGVFMIVTLVIWMRNPFGILVVLLWSITLVVLSRHEKGPVSSFVLSLLAVQVALDSVYDIRVLFLAHSGRSDADTMARLFVLPAWFWASVWMLVSIGLLAWTFVRTRLK